MTGSNVGAAICLFIAMATGAWMIWDATIGPRVVLRGREMESKSAADREMWLTVIPIMGLAVLIVSTIAFVAILRRF